jgi:hypothetical protein
MTAIPDALAIAAAAVALNRQNVKPSVLYGIAEQCRKAGALDEARRLFERIVELEPDPKARALADILNRRRSPPPITEDAVWPVPFLRVVDFLSTEIHAQIEVMTLEALPRFVPSGIFADGHGLVDPAKRVSSIMRESKNISKLFLPYVKAAMSEYDVAGVLGINPGSPPRYELQVTCNGKGAFFKAHTDSGKEIYRHRKISFVYYFNTVPKRFTGGRFLLFDGAPDIGRYCTGAFTRIEPLNNSIIFFPSAALHEVERVESETSDMADSRFTLNGWIS